MDSMSPKSPEQSEKNKKYDRQLRLWGDHGQQALENAHICVVNATSLGTEILKSLVLPGIGSFTIIDGSKVREEDVGANFFLDMESIGKSRAEVAAQFLLELNPDVHGDFIDESLQQILNNNPSFFNNFSLVVGTSLSEQEIGLLSAKLWDLNIPLIICRSYGFIGAARLQVNEHTVIESHPDNQNPDLRIIQPFPALKEHLDSYDLDSMELKDHAHVPYVVILYKCAQQYFQINGKFPQTYKEKESFKEMIRKKMKLDENGIPHHEENFEEALHAVNFAITSTPIPNEIKNILNDDKCVNLTVKSKPFWIMARALKDFFEKEKCLPVRGTLPDMTAETKSYVNLQQIYRDKASKDADSVYKRAQQLLRQLNQSPDSISEPDVKLFCKHASDLRILRTTYIESEYKDRVYNSSYIASQLEDPDSMMDFYVILRSIERFYTEFKEYPGDLDDHVEPDIVKLKTCLSKLLAEIGCGGLIKDDVIHEFCRYGGAELHSVSAFLGGCIAHEIIKLVTSQYVPFNNILIYNAVTSNVVTFTM
ncbi:NEDD8-activating enzyme E1 regulatory subunit isoform X2 [Planococcus citri]|uniref:NEDD8-activating enzyme E1 regulatory subunit isoform X2 n=1 Tax=Planococcus citri TaxID=170843 RepID=UPI0031F9AA22